MTLFFGYLEEIVFVFGSQQIKYGMTMYGIFGIYPACCSELLGSVTFCLSISLENYYISLLFAGISPFVDLGPVCCPVTTTLMSSIFVILMFALLIFVVRLGMVHILALYIPEKNVECSIVLSLENLIFFLILYKSCPSYSLSKTMTVTVDHLKQQLWMGR